MALIDTTTPTNVMPVGDTSGQWTLTFSDEFNSTTLDSKWTPNIDWYSHTNIPSNNWNVNAGGNSLLQVWPPSDVSTSTYNTKGLYGNSPDRLFHTRNSFTQVGGYWEAKIKMPIGASCWPSFWTYHVNTQNEMDIMETYGSTAGWGNMVNGYQHPFVYSSTYWNNGSSQNAFYMRDKYAASIDLTLQFFVYAMKWDSGTNQINQYLWWYDSSNTLQGGLWGGTTNWGYSNPMFTLIGLAFGGAADSATDTNPPRSSGNPMQIDYVRVWKPGAPSPTPSPTPTPTPTPSPSSTTIMGMYGDSTTWGWDGSQTSTNPGGVQVATPEPAVVQANYPSSQVFNDGVNGTTAGDLLNGTGGFPRAWGPELDQTTASVVVVNMGQHEAHLQIDIATYQSNLSQLVDIARQKNKTIVFETLNPSTYTNPGGYAQAMRDTANSKSPVVPVIDQYQYLTDYMASNNLQLTDLMPDGVHPNQSTYTLKGQYSAQTLRSLLGTGGTPAPIPSPSPGPTPSPSPTPSPAPAPAPSPAPSPGTGNTYYVSPTGNDNNSGLSTSTPWRTPQKGASTAQAGDTVIFMDGTYVTASVNFQTSGTASQPITFKAQNKWSAIISSTSTGQLAPGFSITGSYIIVKDLAFVVDPSAAAPTQYTSANCDIRAWNTVNATPSSPTTGVVGFVADGVKVTSTSAMRAGAIKSNQDFSYIQNCDVTNLLEMLNVKNSYVRSNTVRNQDQFGNSIVMKGGVRDCLVYDNIVYNLSSSSGATGILLGGDSCSACTFDTTHIEAYNCVAFNNVVVDNSGGTGLTSGFWGASNCTFHNNVFINGKITARSSPTNGAASVSPRVINNIFSGNNTTYLAASGFSASGTSVIDYNDFYNYSIVPTQAHAITGNPLFVNAASDWHLQSSSPCLHTGTVVTNTAYAGGTIDTTFDFDNVVRTSPWSLGIYSYNQTTTPAPTPSPGNTSAASIDSTTPNRVMPLGDTSGDWTLNFSDEFNSTALNTNVWSDKWPTDTTTHLEVNYDINANSNSALRIWPPSANSVSSFGSLAFGSDPDRVIHTIGKYHQTQGYFEVRLRACQGTACFVSFWLRDTSNTGTPQLHLGRFQIGNVSGGFAQTLSNGISIPVRAEQLIVDDTSATISDQYLSNVDFSAAYHTFAIQWDANQIQGIFDKTYEWSIGPGIQESQQKALVMSLSYSTSGQYTAVTTTNPPRGPSNSVMLDYVRAWTLGAPPAITFWTGKLDPTTPSGVLPYGINDGNTYSLAFSDEFSQNSLNPNVWKNHSWFANSDDVINYDTNRNGSSRLNIWPDLGFVTRTLTTDGIVVRGYGYYEILAKLPRGKGLIPFFRLYNHDNAAQPAIDILKAFPGGSTNGWADSTFHPTAYQVNVWQDAAASNLSGSAKWSPGFDLSAGFHYYGVSYTPNFIYFYFDGGLVQAFANPFQPGQQFFIMLGLDYGSFSGSPDSTTPTSTPNSFEVQHIRAWNVQAGPPSIIPAAGGGYNTTFNVFRNNRYR